MLRWAIAGHCGPLGCSRLLRAAAGFMGLPRAMTGYGGSRQAAASYHRPQRAKLFTAGCGELPWVVAGCSGLWCYGGLWRVRASYGALLRVTAGCGGSQVGYHRPRRAFKGNGGKRRAAAGNGRL